MGEAVFSIWGSPSGDEQVIGGGMVVCSQSLSDGPFCPFLLVFLAVVVERSDELSWDCGPLRLLLGCTLAEVSEPDIVRSISLARAAALLVVTFAT